MLRIALAFLLLGVYIFELARTIVDCYREMKEEQAHGKVQTQETESSEEELWT